MAVKDDSTLITKGDLKKFYNKILPYMGGNYVFNTLGTKDYYSEDEKVIGVWTDGKPVYQKTFLGNLPSSDLSIDVSSLNIDTFIESQGMVKDSGDNCISTNYWNGTAGGPWYHIPYYSSSTSSLKMMFSPSVTYNGRPYIITIKYTKTTDAANSAVDTVGCYDITRPDLWPENKEITFGNGLYGQRFTGSVTHTAAHTTQDVVLTSTIPDSLISSGGKWNRGSTYWTLPIGQTTPVAISTNGDIDLLSVIAIDSTRGLLVRFYNNVAQTSTYDICVTYKKK